MRRECSYYDMARKTWRHTDLCEHICNIGDDVPSVRCKSCGKVFRVSATWAPDSKADTRRFEMQLMRLTKEMPCISRKQKNKSELSTHWFQCDKRLHTCIVSFFIDVNSVVLNYLAHFFQTDPQTYNKIYYSIIDHNNQSYCYLCVISHIHGNR